MKDEIIKKAKAHNECVDKFDALLKKDFGSEINAEQWFKAQRLIKQQNFYNKGMAILNKLKANGIDCKMDMQSHKLVW